MQNFSSINKSKRERENCGKLCIFSILHSKRGMTPTKIDRNWRHLNLICSTVKQSHMQYVKACRRKVRKTAHYLYSKFTKRHNSFKNWRKVTTLKLDLYYIKTKSCAKFQLNMSKHVWEKCGKRADGDPDGESDGRISPYHNTSRLKTVCMDTQNIFLPIWLKKPLDQWML